MKQDNRNQITQILENYLNEQLQQIILSNPIHKELISKVKVRPLMLRECLIFQSEEQSGQQVFHKNHSASEMLEYLEGMLSESFRQLELISLQGTVTALVSKRGTMTVKVKKKISSDEPQCISQCQLSHNRQKQYILREGTPVGFLEELGVMTAAGKVIQTKYDKFRQINRFLELIEDILPRLDKSRESTIIDFGCGKSYLTFAMYYYLKELKGYPVKIIGLDLKQEVIDHCNRLRQKFGYEKLDFYYGDIASYEGVKHVDMVVTLHACDTATDYALEKAVRWGAEVILSVPCCQHEVNKQMNNTMLAPIFQYGLIKERMAALYTDTLRAEILENQGYRTQILEFIDMEHTPKNILIRAVKQGKSKDNKKQIEDIMEFLQIMPTLAKLLPLK